VEDQLKKPTVVGYLHPACQIEKDLGRRNVGTIVESPYEPM